MDQRIQNILGLSLAVFVLFGIAAGFWYVKSFAESRTPARIFYVEGEGKVVAVPNVAQLFFGVTTEGGKNISALQKENTEKANAIISFLKEQGIGEKDIKTESYTISPRYQYYRCPPEPLPFMEMQGSQESGTSESFPEKIRPCPPSEIVGYTIRQSISVKVRDLGKIGSVLGGITERGATEVSGPTFVVDDPAALKNQAREKAIAQAREKAESLAKTAGFKLGRLVSIQEGFATPYPTPLYRQADFGGGEQGSVPQIEPGSQEIVANVTLSYEIR